MERKPQYNAGLTYSEEIVNKAQEVPEMLLQHSFLFIKYRALALIGAGCIFFFQNNRVIIIKLYKKAPNVPLSFNLCPPTPTPSFLRESQHVKRPRI